MKIAVVGAGIIGITTAYELAVDGHDVTVFERRGAAAEETSFANAGVVAPGSVTPWAAPGMPGKVLGNLMVDVKASNVKLRDRAVRIVRELTGVDYATAEQALVKADWKIKDACRCLERR